jgi:hypothetical protein
MDRAKMFEELEKCLSRAVPIGLVLREAGYRVVISGDQTVVNVYSGDVRVTLRDGKYRTVTTSKWGNSSWVSVGRRHTNFRSRTRQANVTFDTAQIVKFLEDNASGVIRRLSPTKRYKLKTYEPVVRKTIAAYQLFMFGNKKDIHNPKVEVEFKVDVWFINSFPGLKKNISTTRYTKCSVDLENECIFREWKENGIIEREIIQADNVDIIMDGIQKALNPKEG